MTTFAAIGLDHRHVYHLIGELLAAGARCAGYWTGTSDAKVLEGVRERFPALRAVDDRDALLEDPAVDLIVSAAVPAERTALAVQAMRRGKDVLVDKPGVTSFEQLAQVQAAVAETGRIFSICFSERHIVPAVEAARRLVGDGAIGEVVQTLGLGPHRLNRALRPGWFFDRTQFGGILVDIASHQIDQFLVFTGAQDAQVVHAAVGHHGTQTDRDFQDFGEIVLCSRPGQRRGYVRVDWFTPDGLPTWGDGRLFILGTTGSIEIRKYLDIEGRPGTNHLFLADARGTRHMDCSAEPLGFFRAFLNDVRDRTETAMTQAHVFTVCRLALEADALATAGSPA
ncbi:MAG: Gfo/Idh/MocA family oxidoreductase [Betaproteobacteria bacterium]